MQAILRFLRHEPAMAYQAFLAAAVALVVAYAHLSHIQNGYLTAIALGVGTLVTAFLATPVNVAVVSGALSTILSSLVVFSVHIPPTQVAAIVGAIGTVVGLVLRAHLTPVKA